MSGLSAQVLFPGDPRALPLSPLSLARVPLSGRPRWLMRALRVTRRPPQLVPGCPFLHSAYRPVTRGYLFAFILCDVHAP